MKSSVAATARALALGLSIAGLLASGCRPNYSSNFPLEWRGVEGALPLASSPVAEGLRKHTLQLEPFVDKRADPKKIGLVEADHSAVTTTTDVAAYCTKKFQELLTAAGAKFATTGATVTLKPELVAYQVIEGGMFNGDVIIRVVALEDGKEIYGGTHSGKSKRWGASRNPENYNEALSNALLEATKTLLKDDLFAKALGATTTASTSTSQ